MGKKNSGKPAATKAGTAASKASTAAAGKAMAEESSGHQTSDWAKSLISETDIKELKNQGLLHGMEYKLPGDEEIPDLPAGWQVIFLSFLF